MQGVKGVNEDYFNWAGLLLKKQDAELAIPRRTAQALLRLQEKGKVPKWVLGMMKAETIKLAAM